jgi:peptide/nickel transport system permease protein
MLRFIVKRLASAVLVMFTISVLVFLIFFATPGVNPAARIAGRSATPAVLRQVSKQFGLNRPLPIRYGLMMYHLFIKQDLTSYVNIGDRIIPQITAAAPITLSLIFGAVVIWLVVGVLGGVIAAKNKGRFVDPLIMFFGIAAISIPVYWLGQVVLLITQGRWHTSVFAWVPNGGFVPLSQNPFEWALHLLFPWITLASLYAGIYARVLRGELINNMNEDYIRTARAKGLSERRILYRHALRCSLITIVSLFGLDVGVLVGGAALLTEVVFGLQGVGWLTYQGLQNLDLPLIMGCVMYGAFFVVLASAVVDVLYAYIDPRIRVVTR